MHVCAEKSGFEPDPTTGPLVCLKLSAGLLPDVGQTLEQVVCGPLPAVDVTPAADEAPGYVVEFAPAAAAAAAFVVAAVGGGSAPEAAGSGKAARAAAFVDFVFAAAPVMLVRTRHCGFLFGHHHHLWDGG